MKLVPSFDRCTCSEEVAYLAVGKVEPLFQKLKVKSRLVSPEASSPYPWISCYGLLWAVGKAAEEAPALAFMNRVDVFSGGSLDQTPKTDQM